MFGHDRAAQIVALLDQAPHSCTQIAEAIGLSSAEVMRITEDLWTRKLLEGLVRDGCCQDPCGQSCIVVRRQDRLWQLSRKGRSTLRHFRKRQSAR